MIRAVLLDLDDTLYPEGDFYRSGFAVVAAELEHRGVGDAAEIRERMAWLHFNGSRDRVFDLAAERFGFPSRWVSGLISLFHAHVPRLHLHDDSAAVLEELRGHLRLGIVTDGHADVQRRKIAALGVEPLVDTVVVSDDFGRRHWKPHPLPFLTCCRTLRVVPNEAVFVGDNPARDMQGAQNAGLWSIRIRRADAFYRDTEDASLPQPAFQIKSLAELHAVLGQFPSQRIAS